MTGIQRKGLIWQNFYRMGDILRLYLENGIWDVSLWDLMNISIYRMGQGKQVNRGYILIHFLKSGKRESDSMKDM